MIFDQAAPEYLGFSALAADGQNADRLAFALEGSERKAKDDPASFDTAEMISRANLAVGDRHREQVGMPLHHL